jgi:hypothetical protein
MTYIPIGRGLPLSRGDHRLGFLSGSVVEALQHDGALRSVSRLSGRPSRGSASRRYSTQTRARSSLPKPSPGRSRRRERRFPRMDAAAGWIMCSSSGCGDL